MALAVNTSNSIIDIHPRHPTFTFPPLKARIDHDHHAATKIDTANTAAQQQRHSNSTSASYDNTNTIFNQPAAPLALHVATATTTTDPRNTPQ
eukprot:COSAG05_NODE_491_length_9309_cov_621.580726_1_plen_92_part_10